MNHYYFWVILHTLYILPGLMKPYPWHAGTCQPRKKPYCSLSKSHVVFKNVFGQLKAHWRCLLKRMDNHNVPDFVAACVVLHNVCEMFGDECHSEWITQPSEKLQVHTANENDGLGIIAVEIWWVLEDYLYTLPWWMTIVHCYLSKNCCIHCL